MKSPALSFDLLDTVVRKLANDGLVGSRLAALEHLRKSGIPTVREEDWKYTDFAAVVDIANEWLASGGVEGAEEDAGEITRTIDADWLVIENGRPGSNVSIAGVTVTRLSEAGHDVSPAGRLGDLNVALLNDGLHIAIGEDVELSRPLGILVSDHASSGAGMSQVRVDIDAAPNCKASIVEFHRSTGGASHFSNSVVNLTVGAGAQIDVVTIQDRSFDHSQASHLAVTVGRDASFRHGAFDFGGKLVRNDVVIDVVQPGSRSEFCGLYLVGDGQHVDNHTRVDHRVGPAESRQEYRGILTGKARGVWNGKAIVHEGADGTDAEQSNHNLLLSRKAEINAKPELEIYTDDVKCSHGTTVGQLDETALFYLRSRGLSRHEARQLLTRAFAQAIVSKSPVESLHDFLNDRIAARLDRLMLEGET